MGKLKKCICLLIAVVLLAAVVPTMALAADDPTEIYVSEDGNDILGDGTQGNPYATLARAAAVIEADEGDAKDYTIYIMSDLTMTASARFWKHDVSIQSDPEKLRDSGKTAFTLSRAETGFRGVQDPARGGYNGALIEIGNGGDLTLSNIILDDGHHAAYSYSGETAHATKDNPYFVQVDASRSDNGEDGLKPGSTTVNNVEVDNHEIVQDAMIASYDSNSTITLGAGTTLQNYGGMSAVRVTGSSKLVMELGSKICDTDPEYTRSKGAAGSYGPAGAVWIQSGNIIMEDGSEIKDMTGRAIYNETGQAILGGTISNITSAQNVMWQGNSGSVLYLRGNNEESGEIVTTGHLTKTCQIDNISGGGSAIATILNGCKLDADDGSIIENVDETIGISINSNAQVFFDGEITDFTGKSNAMSMNSKYAAFNVTLGPNSNIHHNYCGYGTVYIQAENGTLNLKGKINNNITSDRGGGVAMANNYDFPTTVNMYEGAQICNNISAQTGGGVMVSVGQFTMYGGTISGNTSGANSNSDIDGGGVFVRRGGEFIMEGGTIENNNAVGCGGGIAYEPGAYNGGNAKVILNGGTIKNNSMHVTVTKDGQNQYVINKESATNNDLSVCSSEFSCASRYATSKDAVSIGNEKIFFEKYNFSIKRPAEGVKFGNAATDCETKVTTALSSKNLTQVVGAMWYQTDKGNLPLTVYDLTKNVNYNNTKDLYAAVVNTNEAGTTDSGAAVALYKVDVKDDGSLEVNLPGGAVNGTAVVFLQAADSSTTANIITLKPVDLTAYMGGDQGYDAVVDGNGDIVESTNSLPHPLFTVTGVSDATDMVFSEKNNGESAKTWTLVKDGTGYYHFQEDTDQEKVRVTYTNDKTGETTLSDAFELKDVHDTFNTYTVALYTGEVDMSQVTATLNGGTTYAVALGTGKLTVRAVADTEPGDDPTIDVIKKGNLKQVESGKAVAVEPEGGTTYTLNDTEVTLPQDAKPSLLFDSIIEDEGSTARTDALKDKVDDKLGTVGNNTTRHYEVKYLDLVDANNGNAWITSSAGMDIYWGYPEGTDINTEFHVLHFEDLHRDGAQSGFEISDIESANVIELTAGTDQLKNTEYGIKFHVESGDFSPYVLVWEKTSTSQNPGIIPTPDPDPTPTPDPEEPDQPELERDDHYAYIFGYEDNTIRPENDITRAEVATIFYRLLTDESREAYRTTDHDFTDVSADAWHVEPVATLAGAGLLAGYEDGSFRPDAPITRAEYAAIATRFDELAAAESNFTDISGHWAEDAINAAYGAGWVGGYEDGTFRPDQNITRAEAMALINRVLERAVDSDGMLDEMTHWDDNDPAAWYYADIQEATHSHTYEREEGEQYETWTDLVPHKVF